MNIPENDKLNTQALSHIFDNKSESYKLFWFKALLKHVFEEKTEITYDSMINYMLVDAWYMVSEYKLNLGPSDAIEETVCYLSEISGMPSTEKPEAILAYLENTNDRALLEYKRRLSGNVPYRLQAPLAGGSREIPWRNVQRTTDFLNNQEGMIYSYEINKGLNSKICINNDWVEYLTNNYGILDGWTNYNMISYLQRRNPSVPGIASKLAPPQARDMSAAKAYWKAVITAKEIRNIYSGEVMGTSNISIDHFVPWSYVAHDELWNLIPTTRGKNSSKGNSLPVWEKYFPLLADTEYKAYKLVQEYDHMRELQDKYETCIKKNVNDENALNRLYRSGLDKYDFTNILEELVFAPYESARKMGFGVWEYNGL